MSINAPPCAVRGYRTRQIVHMSCGERGQSARKFRGPWVAFQHVCSRRKKISEKVPPLTGTTVSRHVLVNVVVQIKLRLHRETGTRHHRVPAGHHSSWRAVERFASCVDGDVVGRESAFRNGRRRRLASLLSDLERPIKNRREDDTSGSQDKPTATWSGTERSKAGRWTWTADCALWGQSSHDIPLRRGGTTGSGSPVCERQVLGEQASEGESRQKAT